MTRALMIATGERRRSGRVTSGLGTGWRTVLTDLSLILFMVTASVLPEQPGAGTQAAAAPAPKASVPPAERSQPIAVWRPEPGAPSLSQWLASADGRALLSLRVTYRKDHAAAVARAAALATIAGDRPLRVLVEPGASDATEATLAYDAPGDSAASPPASPPTVARSLQDRR